jgi:hypothetical protein
MKILIKTVLAVFVSVPLLYVSSCADKIELDRRAFVTAIGVDLTGDENDKFEVTVSIAVPSAMSGGGSGDKDKQVIKNANGGSLTECFKKIDAELVERLYLGHLKAVVFGKKLLKNKEMLAKVVAEFTDGEIARHDIKRGVYAVKASDVSDVFKAKPPEGSAGLYIERYYKNSKGAKNVSIDAFARKFRDGKVDELPVIEREGDNIVFKKVE